MEVVFDNAVELGVSRADEFCRVLVHGLLHMIGFDDDNDDDREEMRQNEDKCLLLRPKNLIDK